MTRSDDERENRALHGLTRSLIANMVEGVTTGYTKKLEIVGVGYQAQLKKANTVALQVGFANQVVLEAPTGVSVVVDRPHAHRRSPGPTSRPSASSPPWSAKSVPPSRTRARASATKAKSSAGRPARRSAPSNPPGRDPPREPLFPHDRGWASGRDRPPRNPLRPREGPSGETARTRQRPSTPPATPRPEAAPRDHRAAPPGRLPKFQAHLRRRSSTTTTAQPWPRPAPLDPEIEGHQLPTAATRPLLRWSAGSSPSGPSRPVLTRSASTVEATSIMAGSRPWPTPPARRGSRSDPSGGSWSGHFLAAPARTLSRERIGGRRVGGPSGRPLATGLLTTYFEGTRRVERQSGSETTEGTGRRAWWRSAVAPPWSRAGAGSASTPWWSSATVGARWPGATARPTRCPPSVEKGVKDAHKQMNRVNLRGSTIPHRVIGKFGAARVVMLPASPGTGVIAGGAVRAVVQAAGDHRHPDQELRLDQQTEHRQGGHQRPDPAANQGRSRATPGSDPLMQLHDVDQSASTSIRSGSGRPRNRLGPRQDREQGGTRGTRPARGSSSEPFVRGRPDAPGPPRSEARVRQRRVQEGLRDRQPREDRGRLRGLARWSTRPPCGPRGLVKGRHDDGVKILGDGEIRPKRPLTFQCPEVQFEVGRGPRSPPPAAPPSSSDEPRAIRRIPAVHYPGRLRSTDQRRPADSPGSPDRSSPGGVVDKLFTILFKVPNFSARS